VWGAWKEYSQDQVNAISLLWRLELAGADVGDRWQDVANYVAERTGEHVEPFLNLHYIYALARAGRDGKTQEMLDAMTAYAASAPEFTAAAWGEVALPAAKAFAAHARGDMAAARALLDPVHARMQEIGGSNAQRDLFEQTWLDVLMKTGSHEPAIEALEYRALMRPAIPVNYRLLAEVYGNAGMADKAAAAKSRLADLSARG
jgi:predicted Zn-dependent protease